jgi:DNA-directed RNA polymerase subunit M/transcription elongation factor TFIIS
MAPHVIPWYRAEDRATRDALDVQACKQCGAVLWRRESVKDRPAYAPGALVGDDCPGSEENSSMAKKTATDKPKKKRPEQVELPGTDDSAIAPLEGKAKELRRNRDEIAELKGEGAKIEQALITLMHKHGKKTYRRHGIEIVLVGSSEKVKVRYPDDDEAGGDS